MAVREAIWRMRTEFDGSGTAAATAAEGRMAGAHAAAGAAAEKQTTSNVRLELSKRHLIRATGESTRTMARFAATGVATSGAMNLAAMGTGLLTRSIAGLAGPIGLIVTVAGFAASALFAMGAKAEGAKEKVSALDAASSAFSATMEKVQTAAKLGFATPEQAGAIRMLHDRVEAMKSAAGAEKLLSDAGRIQEDVQERVTAAIRKRDHAQTRLETLAMQYPDRSAAERTALKEEKKALDDAQVAVDRLTREHLSLRSAVDSAKAGIQGMTGALKNLSEEEQKWLGDEKEKALRERTKILSDQKKSLEDLAKEGEKAHAASLKAEVVLIREFNSATADLDKDQFKRRRMVMDSEERSRVAMIQATVQNAADADNQITLIHGIYAERRKKIDQDEAEFRVQTELKAMHASARIMGALASLVESSGQDTFNIVKALRMAEAIVNTAAGVTAALAEDDIPGAIAIAAEGAAQIATIESASMQGGGSVSAPSMALGGGPDTGLTGTTTGTPTLGSMAPGGTTTIGAATVNLYIENLVYQGLDPDSVPAAQMRRFVQRFAELYSFEVIGRGNRAT